MQNFLPQGRVTGIGSLPHHDPEEAVRFVAQACPEIPFWPQLPQRSPREGMIAQMLSPVWDLLDVRSPARFEIKRGTLEEFRRRVRDDTVSLDEESASGFYAFERACLSGAFPAAVAVKGQITGPITLARCLFADNHPVAELPATHEDLTDYLCQLGVWQVETLRRFGLPVIIFVDDGLDPAMVESHPYLLDNLKLLVQTLREVDAYVGVHCCATMTPVELCATQPDIISFDANLNLETFLARPAIHDYVANGGALAYGLVPTLHNLDSFSPSEVFTRWKAATEQYASFAPADHALITATCGLGLLNIEAAQDSFAKAHQLSRLILPHKSSD